MVPVAILMMASVGGIRTQSASAKSSNSAAAAPSVQPVTAYTCPAGSRTINERLLNERRLRLEHVRQFILRK
jgi:hypothetical protein